VAEPVREKVAGESPLTRFHQRLLAEELALKGGRATERLASALSEAKVDLNPHQVEAAAFALESLPRGGCMLADEVGLGKTIEAGIVVAQLVAEGKGKVLVLTPATLRAQWQAELRDKFELESVIVDGRTVRGAQPSFEQAVPVIASQPFAAGRAEQIRRIPWDLVVIDEAHRLRNAHRPGNKIARALRDVLRDRPKLLLTATPLQNELMELFGLMSFLDERILGPEHAFKSRYTVDPEVGDLPDGQLRDFRERLSPVVHRTLRRQVREYVRFTNRRSMVEDFAPSEQEQSLYDDVSEYLRRTEAAAIEPGKRTLLTLVYRKLLASSTYAIAPTLRTLADGLRRRIDAARRGAEVLGLVEPEDASAYAEEDEAWSDEPGPRTPPALAALEAEAFELERYAARAGSIQVNAKGEALKRALDRLFTVARAHQWPEKAVVFTESRRTQGYLAELLAAHGWAGRISLLSGDAGRPEERQALVDEFRDRTQILLSTEAGAEGLNLQFCNLVVNYDLPWNPQRIEQRIGRCHRYGQQRDVLVLNFLNRQNAADARLYELLERKLHLFDGVFGASDEILGALETGIDFEKRVLDIYQSCRSTEEIGRAFDALREDLESRIDARMTQARSLLLERFDGEVRRRLRLAGEEAEAAVDRHRRTARAFARQVLGQEARGRTVAAAAGVVRSSAAEGVHWLQLDASALPSRLARLAGGEGWWFVYRFEATGLLPEERLLHLVLLKERDGFRALPPEDAALLARVPAREGQLRPPAAVSVAHVQERALSAAREALLREAERRNQLELDRLREQVDRYAEDCLLEAREALARARASWEEARARLAGIEDGTERARARAAIERADREHRRRLAALRSEEESRYGLKDRSLAELGARARVVDRRALVGTAYFWLT
jgi:superfamily II DNA or RNA helicase